MEASMPKILVAYFSSTGHTREIAEAVATACHADVEAIRELKPRAGFLGFMRAGYEATTKRTAAIHPTDTDPAEYDLVVLGTPVWSWNLSSPMRAYLARHGAALKAVAFFCTEGGSGGARVFRQMAQLYGQEPVATLIVTEPEIKNARYADKLAGFCRAIADATTAARANP
jgi:flavodoxin